jgi:phosphonate transport system ATP-binding protein
MTILEVIGLHQSFDPSQPVLRDVNFRVERGEILGVIGPSGAGKSTLLRCINRLVEPNSGIIRVPRSMFGGGGDGDGERIDVRTFDGGELALFRRRVGMIFQQFNIVKRLSVLENVLSGGLGYQSTLWSCLGIFSVEERRRALLNLKRVGLLAYAYRRADQLSGGEQQRVAIARTLMQEPAIILADEPVSNLDPTLARVVLDTLARVCHEDGITVIVSLHALDLARYYADRILGMREGRIVFQGATRELTETQVEAIYHRRD